MKTSTQLIAFEEKVARAFNDGQIRAPIHLSGGNEVQLINYFSYHFRPGDYVFSTWRSHYHALLAGISEDDVFNEILEHRSITLCFPEHRFYASGIVAGLVPVALGTALALKLAPRSLEGHKVHCFVGDMAARTGAFHEASEYALGHELPVTFIIEDNGKSVASPTEEIWGSSGPWRNPHVDLYSYKLSWPHSGTGQRVNFW
jgi:pyruvate dehydrogenase E1 component alpha subunit